MLYVLLGVAVAMSFVAGVECVMLVDSKKKRRKMKEKNEALIREIRRQENFERIAKEAAE